MKDNLSYMADFKPLSEEEAAVIKKAMDTLEGIEQIPCTSCHYCTAGCPMQIPIPEIFGSMNRNLVFDELEGARRDYAWRTANTGKASECIQCGQCESQCPQHIEIITKLEEAADLFE
jgi:predicted aldo/keto reductase-like oxidoreductase